MDITILGIESSCDDTSCAVVRGTTLLSNVIASQEVHRKWGGVVPELASRAHEQNIVPVVDKALGDAGITVDDIDAIAFTRGPGLLGSLLVGLSFAKGLALSRDIPLIECNHLMGHIMVHFIDEPGVETVHPSWAVITQSVSQFDYSFSGLKTSFLYFLRDKVAEDPDFIERNKADLCASLQQTIIDILMSKLIKAVKATGVTEVAIAGGVSANSGLRDAVTREGEKRGWRVFLPKKSYTTDNAAMIAVEGYFKYRKEEFASLDITPVSRVTQLK